MICSRSLQSAILLSNARLSSRLLESSALAATWMWDFVTGGSLCQESLQNPSALSFSKNHFSAHAIGTTPRYILSGHLNIYKGMIEWLYHIGPFEIHCSERVLEVCFIGLCSKRTARARKFASPGQDPVPVAINLTHTHKSSLSTVQKAQVSSGHDLRYGIQLLWLTVVFGCSRTQKFICYTTYRLAPIAGLELQLRHSRMQATFRCQQNLNRRTAASLRRGCAAVARANFESQCHISFIRRLSYPYLLQALSYSNHLLDDSLSLEGNTIGPSF